ncbi:hypothetical protein FDG96_gp58 [Bacillus phage Mgbh1]|uniref:Uncharacterized protein n=1 Tax=Bacillus phage Mgbh1 TaxID=1796993 RepID=A0A142F1R0_9CAUD|nr:hypothetical protein FDG96_gp58 [Bacillus phage Mgbh1]AMQ66717.1 hypothetical protein [Bacillus phage Mgbh1]
MAKLEGVKVIDMSGGNVERIEYNGEEYVKVDDEPREGDIGLTGDRHSNEYILHNSYYKMSGVNEGLFYRINCDEEGDINGLIPNHFTIFRAVSEVNKLVHDSVEYRKVTDRNAKVGDYIVFTDEDEDDCPLDTTAGKPYKIINVDSDGDYVFIDDVSDGRCLCNKVNYHYELYEKVSETRADEILLYGGVKYKRVEREAREGDVVIFTSNTSECVISGEPYLVSEVAYGEPVINSDRGFLVDVYVKYYGRTPETTEVYAPIDEFKTILDENQSKGLVVTVEFTDGKVGVFEDVKYIQTRGAE